LEGSAGFAGVCEAMGSFESLERLWEVLQGLDGLSCFGGLWLWKALGSFWKALGDFGRLWLQHSKSLTEALGGFGKFWEPLGSLGRV